MCLGIYYNLSIWYKLTNKNMYGAVITFSGAVITILLNILLIPKLHYLGAALALAPICAWIAINPTLDPSPFLMAAAVLLWTAGFDIIYACQDYRSDLETGVVSVPAKIGIGPALWVARVTHLLSFSAMVLLGIQSEALGTIYFVGVACAGALLVIEHSLVKSNDLSKVGLAFFTVNGLISLLVGTLGIIDVFC